MWSLWPIRWSASYCIAILLWLLFFVFLVAEVLRLLAMCRLGYDFLNLNMRLTLANACRLLWVRRRFYCKIQNKQWKMGFKHFWGFQAKHSYIFVSNLFGCRIRDIVSEVRIHFKFLKYSLIQTQNTWKA